MAGVFNPRPHRRVIASSALDALCSHDPTAWADSGTMCRVRMKAITIIAKRVVGVP